MAIPKEFPTAADLDRIKAETGYFDLYNAEPYDFEQTSERVKWLLQTFFENDKKKAEILGRALNVSSIIIDSATDFLFGEPVEIIAEGENDDVQTKIDAFIERSKLQEKLDESSGLLQAVGHTHFKLYAKVEDGKRLAYIEEVPFDQWSPSWSGIPAGADPDNVRVFSYITKQTERAKETFIYIQDYYLQNGKAIVEHSLYEESTGKIGNPVPLSTLEGLPTPAKAGELTLIEDTGITRLPLVTANLRKTVKQRYGQSVLKKIESLLHELNDRLTQLSVQFLKHLNAKLQVPAGAVTIDKDGKAQSANLEVLLAQAGEPDAKYIVNENPLVEQAFVQIEKVLRQIAKETQTPDEFLAESEKGGVEKVEALKVRFMPFLKRVRRYRTKYETAIKDMIRLMLEIEAVADFKTVALKVVFDDGLPQDFGSDVTNWSSAYEAGLASRETAVKNILRLDGEELEAEIERITEDEERMPKLLVGQNPEEQDSNNPLPPKE